MESISEDAELRRRKTSIDSACESFVKWVERSWCGVVMTFWRCWVLREREECATSVMLLAWAMGHERGDVMSVSFLSGESCTLLVLFLGAARGVAGAER